MSGIEIFMVIMGIVIVALSFVFSERLDAGSDNVEKKEGLATGQIPVALMRKELENQVEVVIDEYIEDTVEQTEAAIDKVMNEKISSIKNYSDEVMVEIKKNHDEVVFLYNMLTDKEKVVKNTVKDVEAVKKSIKKIPETLEEKEKPQTAVIKAKEVKELTNNNEMILDLYKKGVSNMEIARELGLGIGEVRLVIDLYKNRQ